MLTVVCEVNVATRTYWAMLELMMAANRQPQRPHLLSRSAATSAEFFSALLQSWTAFWMPRRASSASLHHLYAALHETALIHYKTPCCFTPCRLDTDDVLGNVGNNSVSSCGWNTTAVICPDATHTCYLCGVAKGQSSNDDGPTCNTP